MAKDPGDRYADGGALVEALGSLQGRIPSVPGPDFVLRRIGHEPPPVGERFAIVGELGRGGMGMVFEALDDGI